MSSTLLKPPIREVCPKIDAKNQNHSLSPCPLKKTRKTRSKTRNFRTRTRKDGWSTERSDFDRWLNELIVQENICFEEYLTISFHRPRQFIVDQYLDNAHIRNVILDFFYKNTKPNKKIRIWFFVEREGMFFSQGKNPKLEAIRDGNLHIHIFMELIDIDNWLDTKSRNITIKKKTISKLLKGEISKRELMRESLINHLKRNVWRCPNSKQGIKLIDIGEAKKRVHYQSKALSSVEFANYEHLDFENSDLPICPLNKPKIQIHRTYPDHQSVN